MNYPKTILNLIESFKKLPGIGEKTAERLALSTLNMDDDTIETFSNSLKEVKKKIKKCDKCGSYTENELCDICLSETRDHSTMCVVEESKNVIQFEKVGTYNGVYHVLHGAISPMLGIGPDDIRLKELMARLQGNVKELIIATNSNLEGETTAMYISKLVKPTGIKVSKIASGVPVGGDLEYIDEVTLLRALEGRTEI